MKYLIAALVLASCSGCVYTAFDAPGGVKITRWAIGTGTNIGELQIPTANGMAKLKGYTSEQAEVAGAVVQGVVTASLAEMAKQIQLQRSMPTQLDTR